MRQLLNFLHKYNYWFLFLLLEGISIVLLVRFNLYQQSVFFNTANEVAGKVYGVSGRVKSYLNLQTVNDELLARNMALEERVLSLEKRLRIPSDTLRYKSMDGAEGEILYVSYGARVVNNTINRPNNYITLDKGSEDGVKPEMGVVGPGGVVGIVFKTSPHYSLVISLLNSKSNVSCKVANSGYFGYLKWDGKDSRYAYLYDLPRHATFKLGDLVVTSGYSTVFPEGIVIGHINEIRDSRDGLSYMLRVELATDFGIVSNVRIIQRLTPWQKEELEEVEAKEEEE